MIPLFEPLFMQIDLLVIEIWPISTIPWHSANGHLPTPMILMTTQWLSSNTKSTSFCGLQLPTEGWFELFGSVVLNIWTILWSLLAWREGKCVEVSFDLSCYLPNALNDDTSKMPHLPALIQVLGWAEHIICSQDTTHSPHPLLAWGRTNILGCILASIYSICLNSPSIFSYSTMSSVGLTIASCAFINPELPPFVVWDGNPIPLIIFHLFSSCYHATYHHAVSYNAPF